MKRILSACYLLPFGIVSCGGESKSLAPWAGPTLTLSVSAPRLRVGKESGRLTWKALNATTCEASGSWSGSKPVSGDEAIQPDTVGRYEFRMTCSGGGGGASASATSVAWAPLRVAPTSYANFKEAGVTTTNLPSGFLIRGYGDFYQDGTLALFTAKATYDHAKPPSEATDAVFQFWRFVDGQWVSDNSILPKPPSTCVHPRQALVADFNGDGVPDVFVACHGYDEPPFPGERPKIVLSQPNGAYQVRDALPEIATWHGGAAADINGDGKVDVVLAPGDRPVVYLNDGAGTFSKENVDRFASVLPRAPYWTVQISDVNEDGIADVLVGGSEWVTCPACPQCAVCSHDAPTTVLLRNAAGDFTRSVKLPTVPSSQLVLDFAITGSGGARTIWINRTTDGPGVVSYAGRTIQQVRWSDLSSSIALKSSDPWLLWLLPIRTGNALFIGTDNARDALLPIPVP